MDGLKRPFRAEADDDGRAPGIQAQVTAARGRTRPGERRPQAGVSEVMNIIGDVAGRHCVMVDDIVDTAGTLCAAAAALKERGARKVVAYCVHPVLSGAAIERISKSVLDELVVTDTIPLSDEARSCKRIRQLTVSGLLAETIRRISDDDSVSSLYVD